MGFSKLHFDSPLARATRFRRSVLTTSVDNCVDGESLREGLYKRPREEALRLSGSRSCPWCSYWCTSSHLELPQTRVKSREGEQGRKSDDAHAERGGSARLRTGGSRLWR